MVKKRVRDKAQKITKILETSQKLIFTNGYNKISTNLIAEKAGVAIGTLYKYFPKGKQDLLKEIYRMNVEQKIEEVRPEKIDLRNIEELRKSEFYKEALLQNISEHRDYSNLIEAYETEILTNKDFYYEMKEVYYKPNVYDAAMNKILKDDSKATTIYKDDLLRFSLIEEILIHRYVLFPDMFESDEELADIIIEIFITLANYYFRKKGLAL